MRYNERYDRWILSERELAVKARNRDHHGRKMAEHHAAKKARAAAEKKARAKSEAAR
jgi:hypothetical protein